MFKIHIREVANASLAALAATFVAPVAKADSAARFELRSRSASSSSTTVTRPYQDQRLRVAGELPSSDWYHVYVGNAVSADHLLPEGYPLGIMTRITVPRSALQRGILWPLVVKPGFIDKRGGDVVRVVACPSSASGLLQHYSSEACSQEAFTFQLPPKNGHPGPFDGAPDIAGGTWVGQDGILTTYSCGGGVTLTFNPRYTDTQVLPIIMAHGERAELFVVADRDNWTLGDRLDGDGVTVLHREVVKVSTGCRNASTDAVLEIAPDVAVDVIYDVDFNGVLSRSDVLAGREGPAFRTAPKAKCPNARIRQALSGISAAVTSARFELAGAITLSSNGATVRAYPTTGPTHTGYTNVEVAADDAANVLAVVDFLANKYALKASVTIAAYADANPIDLWVTAADTQTNREAAQVCDTTTRSIKDNLALACFRANATHKFVRARLEQLASNAITLDPKPRFDVYHQHDEVDAFHRRIQLSIHVEAADIR